MAIELDGVNNKISVDTIEEKTGAAGVTVDDTLKVDTVSEKTSAAGVTIDGTQLKDTKVYTDQVDPKSGTNLTLGTSGDSILIPSGVTIANSGTATGFGAIDWQTGAIKTANFSAAAGKGYFCNTTSGQFTATLPGSPSAGDQIGIADYAGTFDTNGLTVDPNGNKIEASTDDQHLSAERQAIILVYVDATQGWIVTEAGDSTTIAPAVITFTTTAGSIGTILDSQRASGYSLSAVTATVTFGTLTYSISSGSLPAGLSMNSAGAITGTATAVSSDTVSTFTVLATASGGVTASREFTIQVDDPIITYTTAAGTLGTLLDADRAASNLSSAAATASSGTLSYALQSGAMPSGLSFNTTTAAITGTADAVGTDTTTNFTVRATTTSASEYLDRAFSITVNAPPEEYIVATGGTITTDGDYKVHVFDSDGTFAVTSDGNACGSTTVDYMVIAGGAGGGNSNGGGGGAGGMRYSYPNPATGGLSATISGGPYPITVGGGGAGEPGPDTPGRGGAGKPSTFSSIPSAGGGGGGGGLGCHPKNPGDEGGSGGGGSTNSGGAGNGNVPPVSPAQGQNGGTGSSSGPHKGGGGGGHGQAGRCSTPGCGPGGYGTSLSIVSSPTPVQYAGGGGGGQNDGYGGNGGGGGGGKGSGPASSPTTPTGGAGTANKGGGGGGGTTSPTPVPGAGGAGGSGKVVIRYKFQ